MIVYQLITKCSVEEKILEQSRIKLAMDNLVMNFVKNEIVINKLLSIKRQRPLS